MFSEFSAQAKAALQIAREECERSKQYYLGVEHLFLGLCATADPALLAHLLEFGIEPAVIMRLRHELRIEDEEPPWGNSVIQTPRLQHVLQVSQWLCDQQKHRLVTSTHLMLAILTEPKSLPIRLCEHVGVDLAGFRHAIAGLAEADLATEMATTTTAAKTPFLDRFGRDLTWLANTYRLDPLIGRDHEIETLALILRKKTQNNALIIGEAGTGKTHLVEGLAAELAFPRLEATKLLKGKRIIEIDLNSLVAGTTYRGDFEARLESLLKEAKDPNIILFIDEFHLILGAGAASGSQGAAQILKPYLARGEIRCIGATTNEEYGRFVEGDKAFTRRFEMVRLREPNRTETLAILQGLTAAYEKYHHVCITDDALQACIEFSERYLRNRCFPEKAIELLDLACAQASLGTDGTPMIERKDIAQIIFQKTGLRPLVDQSVRGFLANLAERLAQRVMGQPEAIVAVVNGIRNAQLGLLRADRPQGVFMLCGSSGVGKTELVRAIADEVFPGSNNLIQINMSEYTEPMAVAALIGAPPGYVGHEQGGLLTEAVRRNPFSVVLFDEIEKAHPDVWKLLLQVFDEGRILDRNQRVADFTNSFIFMTSNLGAEELTRLARPGFVRPENGATEVQDERLRASVQSAVEKTFSSEFRNRIDEMLVFRPLTVAVLRKIIEKELSEIRQRAGLRQLGVSLRLHESAYQEIIRLGYSLQYGARELERVINRVILAPLGAYLSEEDIPKNAVIVAAVQAGRTAFSLEAVGV